MTTRTLQTSAHEKRESTLISPTLLGLVPASYATKTDGERSRESKITGSKLRRRNNPARFIARLTAFERNLQKLRLMFRCPKMPSIVSRKRNMSPDRFLRLAPRPNMNEMRSEAAPGVLMQQICMSYRIPCPNRNEATHF